MRSRPLKKLTHCPLVLVLGQIRFSPVFGLEQHLARIQAELRRQGFPLNVSAEVHKVAFGPHGAQGSRQSNFEFQNALRTESVVINEGFVVYQTSAYDTFETFLPRLQQAADVVGEATGGLTVQRVGLRYIDLIRPTAGLKREDFLRSSLHGVVSPCFEGPMEQLHQTAAKTRTGKMIIRLWQNSSGAALPPDLVVHNLALPGHAQDIGNADVAIIDMDHYCDDLVEDYDPHSMHAIAWDLKNDIAQAFQDSVVTERALEAWQ